MAPRSDVGTATAKKKTTKRAVASQARTTQQSSQSTTTSTGQTPTPDVSPEQRHQMISELAYLRAEKRGFQGGDPVADWVEAEREIDRELHGATH